MKLLESITLDYKDIHVFKDLDFELDENKITCMIGPSGCGKTSILNLITGFVIGSSGTVQNNKKKIGYVFQEDRLLPWKTVYQNVEMVNQSNHDEVMGILEALEIDKYKDKYPDELSGGMKQRCAIARAFFFDAPLLLMDEPFKSLDYDLRINLLKYLIKLWEKKKNTILFVTHDIDEALLLGHEIKLLSKRPTKIVKTFEMKSDIHNRNVYHEEHINTKQEIISLMTQE